VSECALYDIIKNRVVFVWMRFTWYY